MNPEHVPEETYAEFLPNFPSVCVEVVLEHDGGILLARRTNEPAKGEWFLPGGRLYKGEELTKAAHRVAREELGIEIDIQEQLGVDAHFWETSDVVCSPSRDTVNVVYLAEPVDDDPQIQLDNQHTEYRIFREIELDFHEYVTLYFEEYAILDRTD